MKKRLALLVSLLLLVSMAGGIFASCSPNSNEPNDITSSDTLGSESEESGNESENETESENGGNHGSGETLPSVLNGSYAASIEYADSILNGVNYYYTSADRESAVLENLEMSLEYGLTQSGNKQVVALKNKTGASYLSNTMDVFVRMNDGSTYYASTSKATTTSNLFRLGYYFYEARFEGQDFYDSVEPIATKKINLEEGLAAHTKDVTLVSNENGELTVKVTDDKSGTFDPYMSFVDGSHNSNKNNPFTFLEVTMKSDAKLRKGQIYINTGKGFNSTQRYAFALISDGKYHTYNIPLFLIPEYEGKITGIRLDMDGKNGAEISIKEMNLVVADNTSLPSGLSIARSFNAYSDKMHHVIQVSALTETNNIASVGMLTKISADTVEKLIVKDKNGTCDTLDGADWATVEYIGFDIKGAGIFGYILPYDNKSGTLSVTLSDGVYLIEQNCTPKDGTIKPSEEGTNNANDLFMGQRVYTDDNHTFDEFLYEAECERNPVLSKFFKVNTEGSVESSYKGYDALRGIYVFDYTYASSGANDYPNIRISIRGDEINRKIYVMASSYSSTVVESTVLLNENDLLIPLAVEVGKNFSEASGERNLYNIDDPTYSESIFPLVLNKDEMNKLNIVNLYRKWGNFPLKQISWIQFWAPYYHLSTGVTETNCITPYYATRLSRDLNMLPDFRSMSAPPFSGDQKNSGGSHCLLQYTDADGNYVTSENIKNVIGAYGPTYADVTMDYISDDGKIKITYNHMEMPQDDENRTYYEMNYEVLEDVSFNNFAKDFSFYSVSSNDSKGVYTLLGYLGEDNESKVVDAKMAGDEAAYYTLGQTAPYFSYMKMTEERANGTGYVNLAFLVHSSKFIIGGEEVKPNFCLSDLGGTLSISLNYGELTLKKGDKITINCILMPWGSQETVYDGSNGKAPDQNVRDVRQNTILAPLEPVAVNDCEVIETVYVPMLRTTNGKSAEFTLTGGHNNCAVRIYGFEMLTAPKIYELVGDEWVEYKVASAYYSYNHETSNAYDGYGVHYDGDGTYSYSFVAKMVNGTDRTFKIVADTSFSAWPYIDASDVKSNAIQNEYINVIAEGENLYNASQGATDFKSIEFLKEENAVRYYADPAKTASYFYVFSNGIFESGDYLVIKYRVPESSPSKVGTFKFYTSTVETVATYDNHHWSSGTLIRDGEWHVLAIDLSKYEEAKKIKFKDQGRDYFNTFPTADDGLYYAKFLRLDLFNQTLLEGTCIDLQYVGFSSDIEKIKTYNSDMYEIQLSEGTSSFDRIPTGSGTAPQPKPDNPDPTPDPDPDPDPAPTPDSYVSSDSNYKQSDNVYIAHVDTINGSNVNFNSTSTKGVIEFSFTKNMIKDAATLHVAGWMMVEGSISKYVWSIDGKDWYDCGILKNAAFGTCGTSIINAATSSIGKTYTFTDADAANGSFQANSALVIDLTDKIDGKVNVTIAAVPANAADELCIITRINDVSFEASEEEVDPNADRHFVFHVDKVNGSFTNSEGAKYSYNSVSVKGVTDLNLNSSTVSSLDATKPGTELLIGGWVLLQGGISKYVWSVDGETWHECKFSSSTAGATALNAATNMMGGAYTFTANDAVNGQYSLNIDLKDFAGQTVNVTIAAIPEGSTDKTIVLTNVNGVSIPN